MLTVIKGDNSERIKLILPLKTVIKNNNRNNREDVSDQRRFPLDSPPPHWTKQSLGRLQESRLMALWRYMHLVEQKVQVRLP